MKKKASSVGSVLQTILKEYNLEQKYDNAYVIQFWEKLVPENIYKICTPVKIDNGELVIKAGTEAWKKELRNNSKILMQMINEKTNKTIITDLKVI